MSLTIEKCSSSAITDSMIHDAAALFSAHYGVWAASSPASTSSSSTTPKPLTRVKSSPSHLKTQILPPLPSHAEHIHVRCTLLNTTTTTKSLIGSVFGTRFLYNDHPVLWITQLCVHGDHRNQGIAKSMLRELKEQNEWWAVGVLSSHPFALWAVLRVFEGYAVPNGEEREGEEEKEVVDLEMTRYHAQGIMRACPVEYVNTAKVRGGLFTRESREDNEQDGDGWVSCADTGFWVDHEEPEDALRILEKKGVKWPFGHLPGGHEFLVVVQCKP